MSGDEKVNKIDTQDLLFQEFTPSSREDWRKAVDRLLKGAPYEKRMLTPTAEGVTLEPIYNADDVKNIPHLHTLPGSGPYVRGTGSMPEKLQPWIIAQETGPFEIDEAKKEVGDELGGGATAVHLMLNSASCLGLDPDEAGSAQETGCGVSIASLSDLAAVVEKADLAAVPVYIQCQANGLPFTGLLAALADQRDLPIEDLNGAVAMDPLGALAATGSLSPPLDTMFAEMAEITAWAWEHAPGLRTIWSHGEVYHNGGANAVQELAFTLAAAVEYLRAMEARGLDVDKSSAMTVFSFSLGTQFFMEIAKVRAARMLWHNILSECGVPESARTLLLHTRTSHRDMARLDPHVNLLRATTQAMSGVIGGADSLHVAPFDELAGNGDDFSRRIARNIQLIVKHEAHLADTMDPAGGSWFVEKLTRDLAEAAWELFQKVEAMGGMVEALKKGFPQTCIKESSAANDKAAARRKKIMVGTNQYPNATEKPLDLHARNDSASFAERSKAFKAMKKARKADPKPALEKLSKAGKGTLVKAIQEAALQEATLGEIIRALPTRTLATRTLATGAGKDARIEITPVEARRASEPFEHLRAAVQARFAAQKDKNQVFLATLGPIGRYMPRFDFSASFFEVGGFAVDRTSGFDTPEEAADQALAVKAKVVVICGLDEAYVQGVETVALRIKKENPQILIVLAGLPEPDDEARFKEAGVDLFIHARSDLLQTLTEVAMKLEVEL